jgi:hypothetical protein
MRLPALPAAAVAATLFLTMPGAAAGQADDGPVLVERENGVPLGPGDARGLRAEVQRLLNEHPPNLRTVLQADPSLLQRADYLAPYPRLTEFLKQHPEVARDPGYFIGRPEAWFNNRDETAAERATREAYDTLQGALAGLAVFTGIMAVLFVLTTLIKQALAQRRWSRQSRVQTEVHTKILDRLQSNDELIAYIQTPAGQRFLQSGPSPPADTEPRAIAAPVGRIFWSVQAGVVLVALGIGFFFVQRTVMAEIAPAFNAMGVIATALGIGAICSAGVSYILSARFGLLERPKE